MLTSVFIQLQQSGHKRETAKQPNKTSDAKHIAPPSVDSSFRLRPNGRIYVRKKCPIHLNFEGRT